MNHRADLVKDWIADLAIATAAGAFLGLIGPFGSYFNGPAWQRIGFQVVCFWAGILLLGALIRGLMRTELKGWRFWLALIASTAILDLPLAWLSSFLAGMIWPVIRRLPVAPQWYLQALVISVPVVVGFVFLIRHRELKRRPEKNSEEASAPLEGLLGVAPSQILCLQMEDHYVRVHTQANSRLVLATFSQAMAVMSKTPGLQVHRSWWVASSAVTRAVNDGRNLRLQLVNGVLAPVARSSVAAVRAAGWLEALS